MGSEMCIRDRYSADKGQQIHDYNQTAKGRPLKIGSDHAFAAYIEHKIIVDRYSPAAALAAARKYPFATRICVSTLYSYIDKRVFYKLGTRCTSAGDTSSKLVPLGKKRRIMRLWFSTLPFSHAE